MVLVHLVHEGVHFGALAPLIVDYTRFAAGGFVFVAGLGVGIVARVAEPGGRGPGAATFWRRALYLLGVHYALTALVIVAETARGWRSPATDPTALLADVVLGRVAPPYVDVLPLYVAMLAVAPVLVGLVRRGYWLAVATASVVVFAYGRYEPMAWSPLASVEFPFLLWQAFFVAGLAFAAIVPRLDARPRRWWALAAVAWSAFVVLSALAQGPAAAAFGKVPLTAAEWLRYLAATLVMVATSAVAWRRLRDRRTVRGVVALGRRSLAVYGGHVFVQMAAVALVAPLWWLGSAQALVALPMLGVLYGLARALDAFDAAERPAAALRRTLRSWGAPPAGVAVAAALLLSATWLPAARLDGTAGGGASDYVADVDVAPHGAAIDFVDADAGQSFDLDAPASGETTAPDEPTIESLDDDAPVQSGIAIPRYA